MTQKLQETPYYLGLDIGTDSVGWAMTDLDPSLGYSTIFFCRLKR